MGAHRTGQLAFPWSCGVELTVLKQAIVRRATEADVDAVSEDEVGDELEAEATATYDSGDPQPVVRADPDAPAPSTTSSPTYPSSTDNDRNLR